MNSFPSAWTKCRIWSEELGSIWVTDTTLTVLRFHEVSGEDVKTNPLTPVVKGRSNAQREGPAGCPFSGTLPGQH